MSIAEDMFVENGINGGSVTLPVGEEIEIPVNQLGISIAHLVRPIDDQHVSELAETDESEWEPIEVRLWPDTWVKPASTVHYHVVSGNHRTSAARMKGLQVLRSKIIDANDDLSYLIAAIRTNRRHGRNFTNQERVQLAQKLKGLGKTSNEIAKIFGVHQATVKSWMSGRDTNASAKARRQREKQAEALHMLSNAEAGAVDAEWASIPEATVSEREIVSVAGAIRDFLASTPLTLDKGHVVTYLRSLDLEEKDELQRDICKNLRWMQNVMVLLGGEC